jgi:DNA-binding transcriptional LysR family regulator
MSPDVDLETLRLLVAVADDGSLGAGARRRGISQPAASARVRAFETRWRLTVLQRSPRGSALTTDGEAVVAWAREVIGAADAMRSGLSALSGGRRSEVSIAASLTIAEFILPRWLGELHQRAPDVQPRLHVVNSDRVCAMVREGTAALGFIETSAVPADLATRPVGSDHLVVVVHPQHPWATGEVVDDATLADASWVLREVGSGTRSTFEHALGRQPVVAMEASSTTALVGAAVAGVGPLVVSSRSVTAELDSGRLVRVPTTLDLARPLTAVWRPDLRFAPAVDQLLAIATAPAEAS